MDQVASLNRELPPHFQIGEPGAPCHGSSTCTDCVIAMIVRHEKGKRVSAHDVRQASAPTKDPCRGLNPSEALRGIQAFGIQGYRIRVNATASDAIRATDAGLVLVAVGYDGYPLAGSEAEVGGRTDLGFDGPHATLLAGRRNWQKPPADWPAHEAFHPGWRVWGRDPDHHFDQTKPPYDRYRSGYLVRAMDALIGNEGWQVRLIIARDPAAWIPRSQRLHFAELDIVHRTGLPPASDVDLASLPDFGAGQAG